HYPLPPPLLHETPRMVIHAIDQGYSGACDSDATCTRMLQRTARSGTPGRGELLGSGAEPSLSASSTRSLSVGLPSGERSSAVRGVSAAHRRAANRARACPQRLGYTAALSVGHNGAWRACGS